jgi:hypothetical protein
MDELAREAFKAFNGALLANKVKPDAVLAVRLLDVHMHQVNRDWLTAFAAVMTWNMDRSDENNAHALAKLREFYDSLTSLTSAFTRP